ncbi:MAG: ATP-binding protein [Acidobacteria bacterium]|nr:ATP-binding protein [Acidobacteriota bacterium]
MAVAEQTRLFPPSPQSLEESGLSLDQVLQLALKTLLFAGELSGTELATRLGVPFSVVAPALDILKSQRHLEIAGGVMLGAASYRYRITDAGRARGSLFLEQNHYVGHAPVPLEHYRRYISAMQAGAAGRAATRSDVRRAFSHLVLSQRVLDQLGPAINAGHSMFVYGPPGNGKTVISQAIRNLLVGDIAVPHAIEVEGSIIRFFDPVTHEPVAAEEQDHGLLAEAEGDQRWVLCRRPLVMVGGELTLDQLELRFSPSLGFYRAPVQAIANGGVLVIDDFGRQSCSPQELLNRWIVPLESRVDYLTLQTGQKIDFPFMAMIVFATNINPAQLVDEAFIRRIQYKILAESPTVADYLHIFENCCAQHGIEFRPDVVQGLVTDYYQPRGLPLRGCHPRDLLDQAKSLAQYLEEPFELRADLLAAACDSYFVDERSSMATG